MSNSDFESEARFNESVAAPTPKRAGPLATVLLVGTCLAAIGVGVYVQFFREPSKKAEQQEEFNTAQSAPGLSFDFPAAKPDNRLVLTPPPPPAPPAPPVVVPPPIEATAIPTVEASPPAVDQDELKRKAAEEAARLARLRSPMIMVDGQAAVQATPSAAGTSNATGAQDYKEDDPNRQFASGIGSQSVQVSVATQNLRTDALIPQGTLIRGVLETAMQSDLPGMVRAITSQDTWSFDGRRILLPKGTMLTGTYKSGLSQGQTRVLVIWTRALRSDGTSVDLGSYGTDDLGRSGLTGEVDNHYLQRFGAAGALSIIGGVSSFIAGLTPGGQQRSTSSNSGSSTAQEGTSQAQQTISQTMSDMANTALKSSVNIPPTLNIDQGTQIIVFIQRDLDFSALYPNPLKEALNELRRPKRAAQPNNVGGAGYVSQACCGSNSTVVRKP